MGGVKKTRTISPVEWIKSLACFTGSIPAKDMPGQAPAKDMPGQAPA